jgi:hypothetical protein
MAVDEAVMNIADKAVVVDCADVVSYGPNSEPVLTGPEA